MIRCGAARSIHSGWMRATVRAYIFVVCTISAAITHLRFFLKSAEPGKILNRVARAPANSCASALSPTLLSRPARSARWIDSYDAARVLKRYLPPRSATIECSCWCTSPHSRMRVAERKFC